ncbi:hypothetical protein TNCT_33391 [Trichonephila clavata]|uniref:Uncharacterized protein n=1 Tax=Trichonephila clavata TaxID=2740835 RepID=A0A8X6L767_TRICU|nr:hypothetical protein TNCT_33391 [Trichonephila clavata]
MNGKSDRPLIQSQSNNQILLKTEFYAADISNTTRLDTLNVNKPKIEAKYYCDEILVGEPVSGSIIEPTSDLNLGTVSLNIDYNLENSSDRLGILSLSQFDLFSSKQKTALQKETWLDDISAKESETKCENVEQRNKEIENIAMLGFTSRITAPTKFPRIEDSFMETQAIVYSALDSIVQFQTDFHAEQSNLHFHFIDPKSVSTELL